jgi:acyl-CoA thioesterase-1
MITRREWALSMLFGSAALRAAPASYFADLVAAMQVEWPKNETIHIVCHGHSVPAGYFKTPVVQTFDSYPHLLHRGLAERFPHAVLNVIVTAKGGEHSGRGAARFDADVLSLKPKLVLIDYGLNDRGPGLQAARTAWTSMIQKCRAAGIKVILLTPTGDSRTDIMKPDDPLQQHAAQIRSLAAEFEVPLVDSFKIYVDHIRAGGAITDLLSQVNHPNRLGHELVTKQILALFPKQ